MWVIIFSKKKRALILLAKDAVLSLRLPLVSSEPPTLGWFPPDFLKEPRGMAR